VRQPAVRALLLLATAELLAMTLWFSATAVMPALVAAWALTPTGAAWLTAAVQAGFVVGALGSAVFNLPDVLPPRRMFALAAVAGALVNLLLAWVADGIGAALVLRFLTGVALAGVYPPGMKIAAGHVSGRGRGLAIGALVGALTLGAPRRIWWRACSTRAGSRMRRAHRVQRAGPRRRSSSPRWSPTDLCAGARALRSAPARARAARSRRAPGESRLLRSHVGALRGVDLARRCSWPRRCRRAIRGAAAGRLRHHRRGRRPRAPSRGAGWPTASAHHGHDRRDGHLGRLLSRQRLGLCRAPPGCLVAFGLMLGASVIAGLRAVLRRR
jgi:hypothetical protein